MVKRRRMPVWPVAALLFAIGAGCASSADQRPGDSSAPSARSSMTAAAGLTIRLLFPDTVVRDRRVPVHMMVRNDSPATIDLYLHGKEVTLDLTVRRADGSIAWQRLAGEKVQAILKLHPLRAGERIEAQADWRPTEAGTFTVTGRILTESPRLESKPRPIFVREPRSEP